MRLAIAAALMAGLAGTFHRFFFFNNFGIVDAGRLYRSAQPKGDLDATIRERGLASVLNLRGGSPSDWWYADEVRDCRDHDVDFYDLPLSAGRRPTRRELLVLLDLFERCEYPLLVHCKSGADRTGLVSAVYALSVLGRPPGRSQNAFSIWYGHVPLFGPERLHEPLDEYAAWLQARALTHTPERFRRWVERDYRSGDPADEPDANDIPPALLPGPRAELAAAAEAARRFPIVVEPPSLIESSRTAVKAPLPEPAVAGNVPPHEGRDGSRP